MEIGILALQGNYEAHSKKIAALGKLPRLVKKAEQIDGIVGLVIPGGESSTMLKLLDDELERKIATSVTKGLPLLTTCAGTILIAKHVDNPNQHSLNLIDIDVERNSYGRQINSFVDKGIQWTDKGLSTFSDCCKKATEKEFEGVFIRAPKITRIGKEVEVLARYEEDDVLVRSNNVLAATFHPEQSEEISPVLELFVAGL